MYLTSTGFFGTSLGRNWVTESTLDYKKVFINYRPDLTSKMRDKYRQEVFDQEMLDKYQNFITKYGIIPNIVLSPSGFVGALCKLDWDFKVEIIITSDLDEPTFIFMEDKLNH